MLGKKKQGSSNGKIDSLIGVKTTIHGNLVFSGGLHIDGKLIGNVVANEDTSSALIVSSQGCIEGDVQVGHIVLNGTVKGNVYSSESIELASDARVEGNVYYNLLEMAMGAEVNGNLVHQSKEELQQNVVAVKTEQDVVESTLMGYLDEKAPN